MSGARILDRLSAEDDYSLLGDDRGWPWDIGAIAVVDGGRLLDGAGRVRIEELRDRIEARLHLLPRFRQVLRRPPLGLGWPLWVDAPAFDIAEHVRVLPIPAPADGDQLLAACEQVRLNRLDPAKPLWQLWLLPGLPEGRLGLYLRLHHCVADGVAGVAAFGALLDVTDDAGLVPTAPAWTPAPAPSARELLADNLHRRRRELKRTESRLVHPVTVLRGCNWSMWRQLFVEQRAPQTSLNRPIGTGRRLALVRSRLDLARQVAHAHGAKVNDVALTAVTAGLRDLLTARGEPVDPIVLRAMVPINLRHGGENEGNLTGVMMVPLPLGEPDPVRLLHAIAAETRERKQMPHPQAMSTGLFRFTAVRRLLVRLAKGQRVSNLTITNVPGPPVPLYLAGAPLLEVFPVLPVIGNLTLNVAILSYAGQLNLTGIADADACPDIEIFAAGVRDCLAALAEHLLPIAG
jgi:WS/DGAT/MGAT family acyltransferase